MKGCPYIKEGLCRAGFQGWVAGDGGEAGKRGSGEAVDTEAGPLATMVHGRYTGTFPPYGLHPGVTRGMLRLPIIGRPSTGLQVSYHGYCNQAARKCHASQSGGRLGAVHSHHSHYDNWITRGVRTTPARGQYFVNPTPITGQPLCEVARSTHEDVDKALDAAHAAAISWNTTAPGVPRQHPQPHCRPDRSQPRHPCVHRDDGQRQADPGDHPRGPPAGGGDHFRYFAGCIQPPAGRVTPSSTTIPSRTISTSHSAWWRR